MPISMSEPMLIPMKIETNSSSLMLKVTPMLSDLSQTKTSLFSQPMMAQMPMVKIGILELTIM
jgi:hypothetical protein